MPYFLADVDTSSVLHVYEVSTRSSSELSNVVFEPGREKLCKPTPVNYEKMRPYFLHVPAKKVKKTLIIQDITVKDASFLVGNIPMTSLQMLNL